MCSETLTSRTPEDKRAFHLARRFLWAYHHGHPYTAESQREFQMYLAWKAPKVNQGTPCQ
jgi:hypothetical protein